MADFQGRGEKAEPRWSNSVGPHRGLSVDSAPEQNYAAVMKAMQDAGEHPMILSWAGATTTGISPDNVRALARAARDFNARRSSPLARSAQRTRL